MRRMVCVFVLSIGMLLGASGSAHASNSCPSGSRFSGGRAGGVCIGNSGEGIVKTIENGRV